MAADPSDAEEAAWLSEARTPDGVPGESFVALYRRYEGRVYGLGLRMLGRRDLAEELVQETFLRLWRSADAFDPERGPARVYVLAIARRTAITLWRRASPQDPLPGDDRDGAVGDGIDELLLAVGVRDAMQSLSPDHRKVLELCVERDLSQAEAARRLGVPVGTVKSRTHHALRALGAALAERGIDG
ncbi:MAG: RNA polymerase sigma factor [Thermoleophilia bacterium]